MWEKVKLGAIFSVIRNGASIKQTEGSTGIPITRIETISSGILDQNKLGYADINNNKFESYYLSDGDILMSHINSLKHLGKTALVNDLGQTVIHGMNLLLLRTNERCFSKYVKYFFETKIFYGQILSIANQSVNQSSFTVNKLKDLEIPLPPLPIQEKIAEILDKADELRRKDKDLQSKYDELAQAIFIDMFGDPVRNEKGWEIGTIRDLVYEVKYGTSSPSQDNGTYPYLRMNNITYEGQWDFKSIKYINATEQEYLKYGLQYNDLVFNRTNSKELVGKTAVYKKTDAVIIAGYLIRVRVNHKANPDFISAYLNSKPGKLTLNNMCKNIVGQANINAQELQNIKIMLPPVKLQEEFAKKIEIINELKSQTNVKKSEELFQSLLQKAFKGDLVS